MPLESRSLISDPIRPKISKSLNYMNQISQVTGKLEWLWHWSENINFYTAYSKLPAVTLPLTQLMFIFFYKKNYFKLPTHAHRDKEDNFNSTTAISIWRSTGEFSLFKPAVKLIHPLFYNICSAYASKTAAVHLKHSSLSFQIWTSVILSTCIVSRLVRTLSDHLSAAVLGGTQYQATMSPAYLTKLTRVCLLDLKLFYDSL